jgi:hypothetical protein
MRAPRTHPDAESPKPQTEVNAEYPLALAMLTVTAQMERISIHQVHDKLVQIADGCEREDAPPHWGRGFVRNETIGGVPGLFDPPRKSVNHHCPSAGECEGANDRMISRARIGGFNRVCMGLRRSAFRPPCRCGPDERSPHGRLSTQHIELAFMAIGSNRTVQGRLHTFDEGARSTSRSHPGMR